jgi:hypothetical protein
MPRHEGEGGATESLRGVASYAYCTMVPCLQPPTWWSSYAATYSPPTYHFCSQPASRSLSVVLPIPTTMPLSYPVASPPFRRLLCQHYGALQPTVTHTTTAPPAPFPALLSPNLRDLVTTIDPAQPELLSYLLAS